MADLKTTYQDDVLDTSVNEKRKYNMIQNADGTVSFEDVTVYSQVGDSFGAADINATNDMLEKVNSNLEQNNTVFNYYETNQSLANNIQTPIYSYTAKEDGEILDITYGMCAFTNNIMHIMYFVLNNEFIRYRDVAIYKPGGDVVTNSNSCKMKLSKGDNVKIVCLSNHASNIYWYIDTNKKNEL